VWNSSHRLECFSSGTDACKVCSSPATLAVLPLSSRVVNAYCVGLAKSALCYSRLLQFYLSRNSSGRVAGMRVAHFLLT